jgi:hypothetical protein
MDYSNPFWSRYLRLQRATVWVLVVVELSVWTYGVIFSWKPIFWDPLTIIEYTQFRWPPLILTGIYLLFVWLFGFAGSHAHVPPIVAWLSSALPAALIAAYLVWAMYESTWSGTP